jgi:hypothetical protein
MFITREDSIWRKPKCSVHFQTSSAEIVLSIAADIISFVFTPSIGDIWGNLGKKSNLDRGRQNLNQNLKCLRHCHPVPNGSLLMNMWRGKGNDTQF